MSPTPALFALAKEGQEEDVQVKAQEEEGNREQISAADYDPSLDRREDEQKRVRGVPEETSADIEMVEEEDDVEDMFAVVTAEKKKVKRVKRVMVSRISAFQYIICLCPNFQKPSAPALITTTLDSAADPEGYYQVILGEQLDGARYQVFSSLGKGMFANVVKARVLHGEVGEAGKEVAIKIIRCQESMSVSTITFFDT